MHPSDKILILTYKKEQSSAKIDYLPINRKVGRVLSSKALESNYAKQSASFVKFLDENPNID